MAVVLALTQSALLFHDMPTYRNPGAGLLNLYVLACAPQAVDYGGDLKVDKQSRKATPDILESTNSVRLQSLCTLRLSHSDFARPSYALSVVGLLG